MIKEEIKKLINQGESETLEFKASLSDWRSILETISAFANSKGGILIIGITDKDEIKGVKIGKDTIEDLTNKITTNIDPKIYPEIKVRKIQNKDIIVIEIKDTQDKPCLAFGKAFKRVGKSTLKMSRDKYERMILEKYKEELRFDNRICERASLEDINKKKVKWFLRKAKFERRLEIDTTISVKEILEKLGLTKNNRLTNAVILLFGKNPQKFFLQAEVRCARFKGTEPLEFIDMKVFGGNIIDQREDAVEFVKEHIKLHAKIVGTERVETWEYPIEAIREAITNAICHRDYEIASNVQVRIFDDRIEIWGCGPLPEPLTPEDLKKKHRSILRNSLIAKCFFLIKFIEEWGTGTNRIIEECVKHGLPEPVFEEVSGSLVVTFRKYKISEEILKELNERQRKAVEYIKEKRKITNEMYQKINNTSRETAKRDLLKLVERGILKQVGKGRGVYYEFK